MGLIILMVSYGNHAMLMSVMAACLEIIMATLPQCFIPTLLGAGAQEIAEVSDNHAHQILENVATQ